MNFKMMKKCNTKTHNKKSNVWKDKFDMIFCLNYASNVKRRQSAGKRFKDIGILPNDNFNWMFNFQSPYEHVVFDVTKNLKLNDCENIGIFNCMFGHYRIIRSALDMGCERILILEDDNVFLKDHDYILKTIENTPDDYDIVLYSYTLMNDMIKKYNEMKSNTSNKINDYFYSYSGDYWGCGFYSLSKKAIEELVFQYELHARPSDAYTTNVKFRDDFNLKKCCSNTCLSIQKEDTESMHKNLELFYSKMGCNIKDYQ